MHQNPFITPQPEPQIDPAVAQKLEYVAKSQRLLLHTLLVYLGLIVCMFIVPASAVIIIQFFALAAAIIMVFTVANIATKVFNIFSGVILALLMLVPLINLLILGVVNGRATKLLRENGYDVGVLGARSAPLAATY